MEYTTECIFKTYDEEELKKKVTETIEKIILKKAESEDE